MANAAWLVRTVQVLPFLVFLAVYMPAVGQGFIQDDYRWIVESRVGGWADLINVFSLDNGFYRPLVALTFALNEWMFRTNPLGYGLTNVVLALACAAAIAHLTRAIGLRSGTAVFVAAVWLLNFHGVRMATQWISGRTALLLTLGAVLSAAALVRRRYVASSAWLAFALFSKEEATLLPMLGIVWLMIDKRFRTEPRAAWGFVILAVTIEALYFWLRSSTNAMLPGTAPAFYRYTFEPAMVLRNLVSYLDRGVTTAALAAVIACVSLRRYSLHADAETTRVVRLGVSWFIAGAALTLCLPVRSELYACFPSVGAALIAGAIAERAWRDAGDRAQRRALRTALIVVVLLAPILASRTDRWRGLAVLGDTVLTDLVRETASLPSGSVVVITDDRRDRANIDSAFGTLLPLAYEWRTGRRLDLWVEPALTNAPAGLTPPCDACPATRLSLRSGHLVR